MFRLNINGGTISNFTFADDTALIVENPENLQKLVIQNKQHNARVWIGTKYQKKKKKFWRSTEKNKINRKYICANTKRNTRKDFRVSKTKRNAKWKLE